MVSRSEGNTGSAGIEVGGWYLTATDKGKMKPTRQMHTQTPRVVPPLNKGQEWGKETELHQSPRGGSRKESVSSLSPTFSTTPKKNVAGIQKRLLLRVLVVPQTEKILVIVYSEY